jgi:RNA polymerase sigma factor (sigma-70 family)
MDEPGFQQLYNAHFTKLVAQLRRQYGDVDEHVEDAVQSAFRRLHTSDRELQDPLRWVAHVANNRLRDELRRQRRFAADGAPHIDQAPENSDAHTVGLSIPAQMVAGVPRLKPAPDDCLNDQGQPTPKFMAWCLGLLSDKDRQLIELKHMQGLTLREVAAATGYAEKSIGTLLFRARQKLQARLQLETERLEDTS